MLSSTVSAKAPVPIKAASVLANKILTIFIIHLIIVLSKIQQLKDHLSALLCNF
jgi:hypothetical protein